MNLSDRCLQFLVLIAVVFFTEPLKAATFSAVRCENLFRVDSVSAVVSDRTVFNRQEGLKALKAFFGVASKSPQHVTLLLELTGNPVVLNSYVEGVAGRETNSLSQPKSSIIVDLIPEELYDNQDFEFRVYADHTHSVLEFTGINQINGTPSVLEKAISSEIKAHLKLGGVWHLEEAQELTNTLRDLVTIQSRGNSLEVEVIRTLSSTQYPIRGDFVTETVRFTKDAAGKISSVDIIRRDSPHDEFYQSWVEHYGVTRSRLTERR